MLGREQNISLNCSIYLIGWNSTVIHRVHYLRRIINTTLGENCTCPSEYRVSSGSYSTWNDYLRYRYFVCFESRVPDLVSFVLPTLEMSSVERFGDESAEKREEDGGLLICTKTKVCSFQNLSQAVVSQVTFLLSTVNERDKVLNKILDFIHEIASETCAPSTSTCSPDDEVHIMPSPDHCICSSLSPAHSSSSTRSTLRRPPLWSRIGTNTMPSTEVVYACTELSNWGGCCWPGVCRSRG